MNDRRLFLALGAIVLFSALVPYLWPQTAVHHQAGYTVTLAVLLLLIAMRLFQGLRQPSGGRAARIEQIALAGAALAGMAALLCGLCAPDVQLLQGDPGQRLPLGESSSQSVLFPVDATDPLLVDGRAVPTEGHLISETALLTAEPQPALRLVARSLDGRRLTVTHPNAGAFLSPLLLFRGTATIVGTPLPAETLAVPALSRSLSAFRVSAAQAQRAPFARVSHGRAGVLVVVGGGSRAGGIGFVPDRVPTSIADLRLQVEPASYPALLVTPVPLPSATLIGLVAYVVAVSIGLLKGFRLENTSERGRRGEGEVFELRRRHDHPTGEPDRSGEPIAEGHLAERVDDALIEPQVMHAADETTILDQERPVTGHPGDEIPPSIDRP